MRELLKPQQMLVDLLPDRYHVRIVKQYGMYRIWVTVEGDSSGVHRTYTLETLNGMFTMQPSVLAENLKRHMHELEVDRIRTVLKLLKYERKNSKGRYECPGSEAVVYLSVSNIDSTINLSIGSFYGGKAKRLTYAEDLLGAVASGEFDSRYFTVEKMAA